jgi:hypothetical protein
VLLVFALLFAAPAARPARAACVEFATPPAIALAADAFSVVAADVDRDGDLDLLSASQSDDKIAWYENDGAGGGWAVHTLSLAAQGARSVFAADLDGDGDLDGLSASRADDQIAWYEKLGTKLFAHGFGSETSGGANLACWSASVP